MIFGLNTYHRRYHTLAREVGLIVRGLEEGVPLAVGRSWLKRLYTYVHVGT